MANTEKKNFQVIDFFNSIEKPVSEAGTYTIRSKDYESLTLEVSGCDNIELKVEACMNIYGSEGNILNPDDCVWTPMTIIDMKEMDVLDAQTITHDGMYLIGFEGASRLRVNITSITGEATITGTMR